MKYFTSHFICNVSKRVTQSLRMRGSWRPNITEIFWPQSYGCQRCVFLVLHVCSTGALESTVLCTGFPYNISSPLSPLYCLPSFSPVFLLFNSLALYYLQTPHFFWYLATGMCHFRYLWNGLCDRHWAEITVMQFRGHSLPVHQSMRV